MADQSDIELIPRHDGSGSRRRTHGSEAASPGIFVDGKMTGERNRMRKLMQRISFTVKNFSSRRNLMLCLSLIFGICWLVPIIFLLVVNIEGASIGANAWCPYGFLSCHVISYWDNGNPAGLSQNANNDIENHNLLGALQFVAKALEVWYFIIASSLVWYVTVRLAQSDGGIPIGYFFTHIEFGDLLALKDGQLYTTAQRPQPEHQASKLRIFFLRKRLFYFVVFIVFMCITANFMGPSIAVLLVPTLSWSESPPQTFDNQFMEYLAAHAPSGDSAIPGCDSTQLQNQNYNCTAGFYDTALDALIETMDQEDDQSFNSMGTPSNYTYFYAPGDTARPIEQSIPFTFNLTDKRKKDTDSTYTTMFWALSRQTIRDLSTDFQGLYNTVLGVPFNETVSNHYVQYNSSFDIVLQRYAPVIGTTFSFYPSSTVSVTELGDDRSIRCYSLELQDPDGAKCMRVGTAWNASNVALEFTLGGGGETGMPSIQVRSYWADKALYAADRSDDPCLKNGSLPYPSSDCDYDQKFESSTNGLPPGDLGQDMFVVEYSSGDPSFVAVAQFFPLYGFATYNIDVLDIFPSLPAATVPNPPDPTDMIPLVMHPGWFLAEWNVNPDESVPEFADRGFNMQLALNITLDPDSDVSDYEQYGYQDMVYRFVWYNVYAFAHAASLVPYETSPLSQDQQNDPSSLPGDKPALWSAVLAQTWGWSISSHTAKVGLTFCSLGILVTVVRSILLVMLWIPGSSSFGLLTAAMKHGYHGELNADEESERARVAYSIEIEEEGAYTFRPTSDS